MDLVLRGVTWSQVIEYVDEAIVYSKSFDQHLSYLAEVLQRMRDANLKLKPEKCRLFASSVKFLGHIVSSYYCRYVVGFALIAAPLNELDQPLRRPVPMTGWPATCGSGRQDILR